MNASDVPRRLTRRHLLAGAGTALAGGTALLVLPSERATAQVTMGSLDVAGDEAAVDQPPARIDVTVTGEWAVNAVAPPEMVVKILQIEVDGVTDDLAQTQTLDQATGTFDLSADLFDHEAIAPEDLTPETAGDQQTTDVIVRVLVQAVNGGEIAAEATVEDTVSIVLTKNGVEVLIGGEGTVEIVA